MASFDQIRLINIKYESWVTETQRNDSKDD